MKRLLLTLSLVTLLAGCKTLAPEAEAPGFTAKAAAARTDMTCSGEMWLETTFYLGRGLNGRSEASEKSWKEFVSKEITPRFPAGFTILDGQGAWANRMFKTTIYETNKILIILHPENAETATKVKDLAEAYRSAFHQEAVLTSSHPACTTFHTAPRKPA